MPKAKTHSGASKPVVPAHRYRLIVGRRPSRRHLLQAQTQAPRRNFLDGRTIQ